MNLFSKKDLPQYYTALGKEINVNQSDSDSDDSMFGSFNPNIHSKKGGSSNKRYHKRESSQGETGTNKTGSYIGLLMLEKAPEEHLLNGYKGDYEKEGPH